MASTILARVLLLGLAAPGVARAAPGVPSAPARRGEDLAEVYVDRLPAGNREGVECEPTLDDVWRLRSFELRVKPGLRLRAGAADLVVGHHDGSAVWAAVLPDRPARLETDLVGGGEKVRHLLLRFHPARIGELFPARGVSASDDRDALTWGTILEGHKRHGRWARNGLPYAFERDELIVDVDTDAGARRIYVVDLGSGRVRYDGRHVSRGLPTGAEIDANVAGRVFDRACELLGERYGGLADADPGAWQQLCHEQRRVASRVRSRLELGVALQGLLATLDDPRLRVRSGDLWLPSLRRGRQRANVHWDGVVNVLGTVEYERTLWRARTPTGIGYLRLRWIGDRTEEEVDEALEALMDTWALVLDLRQVGGAEARVADEVAGRFLDEEVVWARRPGGAGSDAGDEGAAELRCRPRGARRYRAPLLVLVGPGTRHAGERVAAIVRSAPDAVLLGAPTPGDELFVEWVEVGEGVRLRLPDRQVVDAAGVRLERGLPVDVELASDPDDYHDDPAEDYVGVDDGDRDPVLFAALERAMERPRDQRRTAGERAGGR